MCPKYTFKKDTLGSLMCHNRTCCVGLRRFRVLGEIAQVSHPIHPYCSVAKNYSRRSIFSRSRLFFSAESTSCPAIGTKGRGRDLTLSTPKDRRGSQHSERLPARPLPFPDSPSSRGSSFSARQAHISVEMYTVHFKQTKPNR